MKGAVDSEANSESYEALPSHSHLAKQTGGKAMYPPAGRTGRQGKVTGSFDSDYAMAAPHHDFGHSPSHAPPSRPPRKNNYDYVQPGARPSDSLPIKQVQPEGPPTSSRSRRPDNYDYVQPKPRLASSPFHQADGDYQLAAPRQSDVPEVDGDYHVVPPRAPIKEKYPQVDGDYDIVGARY
eukprot:m.58813 g.58813  ORF g.58813 m.58813 type:complete len:181 (+) comp34833_c0_seq2:1301-1843(+)